MPLEPGDHPELDTSEELNPEGVKKYQSIIGALQWIVSIGRFDVGTHAMIMSSYRAAPKKGHIDRARQIVGYLCKMKHMKVRFRKNCLTT